MANENRVKIILDADGRAYVQGVEKVTASTKALESQTATVTQQLKTHWLGMTAAIYAAQRAIRTAWNMAEQAAQFAEQKQALNRLAAQYNTTADVMIASIQRAADGTISKMDSIGVANKGLIMGLDPSQLEHFMYAAKRLSDALGGDTAQAFERLTQATAAGQERGLKQLGILVDLQGEYKKYGRELTEAEKVTANFNAVSKALDKTIARMGPDIDTAADAMARFKATAKDIGLFIGTALITATSFIAGGLMWLSSGFAAFVGRIANMLSKLIGLGEKLPWVGDKFKGAAEALEDFANFEEGAADEAMRMAMVSFKVGTAIWKETDAVKGAIGPLKDYAAAKAGVGNTAFDSGSLLRNLEISTKPLLDQAAAKAIHLQVPLVMDWSLLASASALDAEIEDARAQAEQAAAITAAKKLSSMGPPPEVVTAGQMPAEMSEMAAMDQSLKRLQEYYGAKALLLAQSGAEETAIIQNINAAKLASDEQTDQTRMASASAMAGMMANTMQSLFVATGSKSKELFLAYKVFATSEAVISAFLAYSKALAYMPPPFNVPFAKTVLAMGLANAAAIASQGMTGGVGASHSAGGASISTGSAAPMAMPTERTDSTPTQNIYVTVQNGMGDETYWKNMWEKNILPAANDAAERNINLIVRTA